MTAENTTLQTPISEQKADAIAVLSEQGLSEQIVGLFRGKLAWVSAVSLIVGSILTIFAAYAAWKFATLGDINEKLLWGGGAWLSMTFVAFMKVWFWMRMESNRVLRAMKRLELQITQLQAK